LPSPPSAPTSPVEARAEDEDPGPGARWLSPLPSQPIEPVEVKRPRAVLSAAGDTPTQSIDSEGVSPALAPRSAPRLATRGPFAAVNPPGAFDSGADTSAELDAPPQEATRLGTLNPDELSMLEEPARPAPGRPPSIAQESTRFGRLDAPGDADSSGDGERPLTADPEADTDRPPDELTYNGDLAGRALEPAQGVRVDDAEATINQIEHLDDPALVPARAGPADTPEEVRRLPNEETRAGRLDDTGAVDLFGALSLLDSRADSLNLAPAGIEEEEDASLALTGAIPSELAARVLAGDEPRPGKATPKPSASGGIRTPGSRAADPAILAPSVRAERARLSQIGPVPGASDRLDFSPWDQGPATREEPSEADDSSGEESLETALAEAPSLRPRSRAIPPPATTSAGAEADQTGSAAGFESTGRGPRSVIVDFNARPSGQVPGLGKSGDQRPALGAPPLSEAFATGPEGRAEPRPGGMSAKRALPLDAEREDSAVVPVEPTPMGSLGDGVPSPYLKELNQPRAAPRQATAAPQRGPASNTPPKREAPKRPSTAPFPADAKPELSPEAEQRMRAMVERSKPIKERRTLPPGVAAVSTSSPPASTSPVVASGGAAARSAAYPPASSRPAEWPAPPAVNASGALRGSMAIGAPFWTPNRKAAVALMVAFVMVLALSVEILTSRRRNAIPIRPNTTPSAGRPHAPGAPGGADPAHGEPPAGSAPALASAPGPAGGPPLPPSSAPPLAAAAAPGAPALPPPAPQPPPGVQAAPAGQAAAEPKREHELPLPPQNPKKSAHAAPLNPKQAVIVIECSSPGQAIIPGKGTFDLTSKKPIPVDPGKVYKVTMMKEDGSVETVAARAVAGQRAPVACRQ
jgi:hypothetical protein